MTPKIMPTHPYTGLTAIGRLPSGRYIWPVIGGDGTAQPPAGTPPAKPPQTPATPPADPKPADPPLKPADDEPLGEGGKKALQAERARADAAEKAHKALEAKLEKLSPLEKLAQALGADTSKDKTDIEQLTERVTNHETELKAERKARWRAEVANEKGLSAAQAQRLHGATRDELLADADTLIELFPAPEDRKPRTPRPDPSQGARGPVDIDARIAEAESKGDVKTSIRLKQEKARATRQTK